MNMSVSNRRRPGAQPPDLEQLREPASIETWLNVFSNLMRLPADRRDAIRSELHAHLRERIRDLMLQGAAEGDALIQATHELGDAAELAARFEHANKSHLWRTLMNASILTLGAGAVVFAAIGFNNPFSSERQIPRTFYTNEVAGVDDPPDWFDAPSVTIRSETTLGEIVKMLDGMNDDSHAVVSWRELVDHGYPADMLIGISASNELSPRQTLDLVVRESGGEIAWWYHDGMIELATRDRFNEATSRLASYDITATMQYLVEEFGHSFESASERLIDLIVSFVSPEDWEDNGGMAGQMRIVGGKLFVKAPQHMHDKLEWILGELSATPQNFDEAVLPLNRIESVSAGG